MPAEKFQLCSTGAYSLVSVFRPEAFENNHIMEVPPYQLHLGGRWPYQGGGIQCTCSVDGNLKKAVFLLLVASIGP